MDDYERYTDPSWWEVEEPPTPRAELRVQKERVYICWVVQAPGIRNSITLESSAPPRGVTSLAAAVAVVALIGGGMTTAAWGLGMVAWAALIVGGLPYLVFCALYLAERRRAVRIADNPAVLGRRLPGGGARRGDATR
jgi:hypothetical protein